MSDTGDGQTAGQWKSVKVENADSSLFLTTFVLFHLGKFSLLWCIMLKFAMKTCFVLQETKFVPVGAVNKPTSTKEAENRYLGS